MQFLGQFFQFFGSWWWSHQNPRKNLRNTCYPPISATANRFVLKLCEFDDAISPILRKRKKVSICDLFFVLGVLVLIRMESDHCENGADRFGTYEIGEYTRFRNKLSRKTGVANSTCNLTQKKSNYKIEYISEGIWKLNNIQIRTPPKSTMASRLR